MNIQRIKGCIQLAPMSKNGGKEKKDEKKKQAVAARRSRV